MTTAPPARAPRKRYVDSRWGQLHLAELGTGAALLLLHQTPRSWEEFRFLMPLLADGRRVIAVDMLGFGNSAPEGPTQSIEGMAAAAVAVLDALGIARADVLGHHTGGAVTIEIAARHPERVRALVLSSAPWTDAAYREAHATGAVVDVAEQAEDGSHLLRLWSVRREFYPEHPAPLLDAFIRDALAFGVDPAEGHAACARYVMEDVIAEVRAPVLLLGADADPFALPDVERLRARLTGASVVETAIVPGGTVASVEQLPEAVAEAVHPFLARMAGPSRPPEVVR